MAIIPGICGPANRPCKISHSSTYPNRVGVYPSEFLPSKFTIWHAVFASQFPLQVQEPLGFGGLGAGIIDGLVLGGGIPSLPGPIVYNWQSHHTVIFARTENRLNKPYILTDEDVANIREDGVVEINIGEYVFEAVAATTAQINFDLTLTDEEKEELSQNPECTQGCSPESEEDRKFRKLFTTNIPDNRLIGIVVNRLGIEFRLDNGSSKSRDALSQAGIGDMNSASYRDGSSKKLEIRIQDLKAGDTIYLTYVAIREHYLRQKINISWQTIDTGSVSECISLVLGYSVSHYRFFEWDLEPEPGVDPVRLSGWRVVESFQSDVNFVAPLSNAGRISLADFPVGAPESPGSRSYPVVPSDANETEIGNFIADPSSLPKITINIDQIAPQGGAYHTNAGAQQNNTAHLNSAWFQRKQFTQYRGQAEASKHVFFNVHPKALKKRDIDKWGIERYLAVEIEKDLNAGSPTFFPFMDDPDVDNPTLGANTFLDASNAKFDPIKPVTSYGGNFEAICASLGTFPTNPSSGINTYHSFESNKITETFEVGTRVLVEHNFAVNADILGPQLITIEGQGGTRGAVTCIADPSKEFHFSVHTNLDNLLVYNSFSSGYTEAGIREMSFRPDLSPPSYDTSDFRPQQFQELLGATLMLGDIPGIQPGHTISTVSYADNSILRFKTSNASKLKMTRAYVQDDQIEEIPLSDPKQSPIVLSVGNVHTGLIYLSYRLDDVPADNRATLVLKNGGQISGILDGISLGGLNTSDVHSVLVNTGWTRATEIEIHGERSKNISPSFVALVTLDPQKTNDFLEERVSDNSDVAGADLEDRLIQKNVFFRSGVASISEDDHSNLYVFFSDTDGGISVVFSSDYGKNWYYYYGIFEKTGGLEAEDPFVVTNSSLNGCLLFFRLGGKILCKRIQFSLFDLKDANLVERFEDRYTPGTDGALASETPSIYSSNGVILRRLTLSYVAAGDLSDEIFLGLLGKSSGGSSFDPYEIRVINDNEVKVRKHPIALGSGTAFTNVDIGDSFFSAYRKENGEIKLWYSALAEGSDSIPQLQCHFSTDDGVSWYDLWEFIEYSYNRLRVDSASNTAFIDRSTGASAPTTLFATNPNHSNQKCPFGINVHWSRLRKHKISTEGDLSVNSESQVLEISSPYVFYQPMTDRVFLFYLYSGCLLCKVFSDSIFSESLGTGMSKVKTTFEQQTRAYFIDGSLTDPSIQEEIHGFINEDSQEIMADGNIVFRYPFAYTNFTEDRQLSAQRVCAVDLPTGLVRVFYKHANSNHLKSALWTGKEWWAEDFMKSPSTVDPMVIPDTSSYTPVSGGFGGTGF